MRPNSLVRAAYGKAEIGGDGCWIFYGRSRACRRREYGQAFYQGKQWPVHRLAYMLMRGPIPPGFQIDHVRARGCTSTLCVRPSHLEAVTPAENYRRGRGVSVANSAKTQCPRGHEYTLRKRGDGVCRTCRVCARASDRKWRKKRPSRANGATR